MSTPSDPLSDHLAILAGVSIDIIKGLAAKGEKLSQKNMTAALLSRPEMKKLLTENPETEQVMRDNETLAAELELLKAQADKTASQKDQLLKQLQELEDQSSKTDDFLRKALVLFINLARKKEDKTLHGLLDRFKALVQNESRVDPMSQVFLEIKNMAFQEDPLSEKGPKGEKTASLLTRLFKSPRLGELDEDQFPAIYIEHLKTAYHGIIDELRLNLGQAYLKKTTRISQLISQSSNFNELRAARKKMLSLIQDFINSISSERALSVAFIKEIGQRIIEIETLTLASFAYTDNTFETNQDFQAKVEKHLDALQNSIDYSKTLAELKDAIVSQLDTFTIAVTDKKKKDKHLKDQMDKKLASFKQVLKLMKNKTFSAEKNAEALEWELRIDPLTGIYNRRAYDKRAAEEMQRFMRYKTDFSLVLFDIDNFKQINDQYGHATGDRCLKEIINRIKPIVRETDFLARYGGEEFIVLLPETSGENAGIAAEKLRKMVENIQFLHKGDLVKITISAGVSQAQPDDPDYDALFSRTDQALYQAKNQGRNRVVLV